MKALFEGASPATGHRPLEVEVYSGTSVGSYNAAYMASHTEPGQDLEIAHGLEQIWRHRIASHATSCGNGVFRLRGSPFNFLEPGCWRNPVAEMLRLGQDAAFFARLFAAEATRFATSRHSIHTRVLRLFDLAAFFDMSPLHHLLTETIDLRRLQASSRELVVVASNFRSGIPHLFWKKDLCNKFGIEPIAASAAIPGLFPATVIGGVPFVDGGVTMNTPLAPAFVAGARVLHVVYLEPDVLGLHFSHPESTLDTVYRMMTIEMASNIHNNILLVPTIFEELQQLQGLFAVGRHEEIADDLQALAQMDSPSDLETSKDWPFHGAIVHKYFPATDLGGAEGLLDFRLQNVDRNIEQGYRDAVTHDCKAAGCIVQPGAAGALA